MILPERRILRYLIYFVFFAVVFGIAASVTFPDSQVKEIAAVQIQKRIGPNYRVRIADVDFSPFTLSVSAQGITIEERVEETEEIDEGLPETPPLKVTLKSIHARFAPVHSVLNLGLAFRASVDLGGGDVIAYYTKTLDGQQIDLNIDDLDLQPSKTPLIVGYLGVPIFGTLDGDATIMLNDKGLPIDGEIKLKGKQLTVGPATVKTDKFPPITYLEVPSTNFGAVNLEFDINNVSKSQSELVFSNVGIAGRDLRAQAWGNIKLGRNFGRSDAKLKLRAQFDDNFVKKNNLSAFLNVNEVRRGKNKNWYGFTLNGRLNKIRFKGAPSSAKGPDASPVEKANSPKGANSKSKSSKSSGKKPSKAAPKKSAPKKTEKESPSKDDK